MSTALISYVQTCADDLARLCEQQLAGTPLAPLLASRYVSWASVIGLLVGGVAYAVRPGVLLQTPRGEAAVAAPAAAAAEQERRQAGSGGPPPVAKTSTTARLCFNTEPEEMLSALKTCPVGGGIDQQDANGWTALMWSAHWGEDEHVHALLDSGVDDSLVTKRSWFNMACEYSEGMSALAIAKFDVEEYDDSPAMLRIVEMLECAALGEWGDHNNAAAFKKRLGDEDEQPPLADEDKEED
jgi:hypothetical protein